MRLAFAAVLAIPCSTLGAQAREPLVEFENMTWVEVKQAIEAGKTTALYYTGGTEQRGPQNTNGGHNFMARATVKAIALALGNAIAMPVLPYTPNNASATLPGTLGLTNEILSSILERLAEQAIVTGFKNVVLMGDHGGGQGSGSQPNVYRDVATKLDAKYAPQGMRVIYADSVYAPAQDDFEKQLRAEGYPPSGHAALFDTSYMIYVCGSACVRMDILKDAVGDPVRVAGQPRDTTAVRKNNGITGDARRSSKELGERLFKIRIEYATRQINRMLGTK
jgi:creatinine amidohydrolase/Fe(II)-dependent formamide hydrolase-like protein